MEKPLKNTPVFQEKEFRTRIGGWKQGEPGRRVIVEWSTGTGPNVFVYPAGERAFGIRLIDGVEAAANDERWADFIEFQFLPPVIAVLESENFRPEMICVDLSPLIVQRARRRQIEAAARAKSGVAAH